MTTTKTLSLKALVERADRNDKEADKPEVAYRFPNGRTFRNKPDPYSGTSS